jgi:HAD superfamily hydrolase (TIGR01509 family)
MTAILFGSIGTLADTSELQRDAFNEAFKRHGLDWQWSQAEYQELLSESGGESRIRAYGESHGGDVDAAAVHATKSEIFQERLRDGGVSARSGVVATIEAARAAGAKVALVTTTSPANISALGEALKVELDIDGFDLLLSTEDVAEPKPAGDVYTLALERLGEQAADAVAIEDNVGGVTAAAAAGVSVLAFPGENNAGGDFTAASKRVAELSPEDLPMLSGSHGA